MQPRSISEKLMFSTVKVETATGLGTGFFFSFQIDDATYPAIVTNKHVVNNNPHETVLIAIHLNGEGGLNEHQAISCQPEWYFHPDKDLCFCFAQPLHNATKEATGKKTFFAPITMDIVADDNSQSTLGAQEEITMVGYPIGLSDEVNCFPIFRKGYTASHPALDFNEKGIALADIACFPGSSGSPILILNEGGYTDNRGNINIGQSRVLLLGIQFAGPVFNATGELIVAPTPTSQALMAVTPVMTNLAYYVKASELHYFQDFIAENFHAK